MAQHPGFGLWQFSGSVSLLKKAPARQSSRSRLGFVPLLILAAALCSCGGRSSSPAPMPTPNGTPGRNLHSCHNRQVWKQHANTEPGPHGAVADRVCSPKTKCLCKHADCFPVAGWWSMEGATGKLGFRMRVPNWPAPEPPKEILSVHSVLIQEFSVISRNSAFACAHCFSPRARRAA